MSASNIKWYKGNIIELRRRGTLKLKDPINKIRIRIAHVLTIKKGIPLNNEFLLIIKYRDN